MAPAAAIAPETGFKPGYSGLIDFCDLIGEPLAPYQRRIARAVFGEAREVVAILPKGNFKTTRAALIELHHLLIVDSAEVAIGAASRRQAEICLRRIKGFARHPAVADRIQIKYWEVRNEEAGGILQVLSAEGDRLHGDSPTLLIGDEVWAWKDRTELLEAMESRLRSVSAGQRNWRSSRRPTSTSPLCTSPPRTSHTSRRSQSKASGVAPRSFLSGPLSGRVALPKTEQRSSESPRDLDRDG